MAWASLNLHKTLFLLYFNIIFPTPRGYSIVHLLIYSYKIEQNSARWQGDRNSLDNAIDDPQKYNYYYDNDFYRNNLSYANIVQDTRSVYFSFIHGMGLLNEYLASTRVSVGP